ncbi:type II toxin-antitoxin system RelB/DinJ family antitoxin [Rugamonas sp. FT107W]|uniref:Type II toxin-antitoxin system RelB/DinJ family antitoxin n=1 Tax=Duganella vulcania TaxID=2692166 RepID=A0A845HMZ3_9BURK|nr:type II toxin-antitoxin system RelB/DinJ family antitoxin [Duganella vulcania]MYN19917.1 type II toxin-antitoxin system RelB/DinJ family antitoxin [Duganella vulcania]
MTEKTVTLQVQVDEHRKAEAEKVLQSYGLTMSVAVNVLLRRIVEDQTLPFELKVPNAETRAAIRNSRKSMAELRSHMDADDLEEDSPG